MEETWFASVGAHDLVRAMDAIAWVCEGCHPTSRYEGDAMPELVHMAAILYDICGWCGWGDGTVHVCSLAKKVVK